MMYTDNEVDNNYKILKHVYNFNVVGDDYLDSAFHPPSRIRVWDNGITEYMYMKNGKWIYHRKGKPAIDSKDVNFMAFYHEGTLYTDSVVFCKACGYSDEETMLFVLEHGHDLPYF